MATYKKGFKKQSTQAMLLKTIIAIIGAVLILVLIAFIYDRATEWRDYSSYDHVETYDQVLTQDQDDYVIYIYSTTCPTCNEMKEEILSVLNDLDKDSDNVYLVNTANFTELETEDEEDAYTRDDLFEDLDIEAISTPMFVVVADGELEEVVTGTVNIDAFLDDLENETYAPFNN
jgi:thioredoxin-related protein